MNLLTDALPMTVAINGTEYPIDPDFRSALRTMLAFEDMELLDNEKQLIMLDNLFLDGIPDDIDNAILAAAWFLNCGETSKESDGPRLFSFTRDARFIFAAFRQTHGIDLETAQLHWWKFQALFMDVGADTTFCHLISLRKRHAAGTTTKEENRAIQEMGDLFDVPQIDRLTLEEMDAIDRFDKLIAQGKANREKAKAQKNT